MKKPRHVSPPGRADLRRAAGVPCSGAAGTFATFVTRCHHHAMDDYQERALSGVTVRIDRGLCIGSGNCVELAPEVFELDEKNIVTFRADAQDIDRERLVDACEICPVDALLVFDEEGEQVVPA